MGAHSRHSAIPGVRSPRGCIWRATTELEPGMVLAKALVGDAGGRVTMTVARGSELTPDTLAQMISKGIDAVAVVDEREPDPEAYAEAARKFQARLVEIFGAEVHESCRALYESLIVDGPD